MRSFFANMSFPRAVIVVSLLGSAVMGWVVYQKQMRLNEIHSELRQTPRVVSQIQENAMRLNELQRAADKEQLKGENDPDLYIRTIAAADDVKIGNVQIATSVNQPMRGIEDHRYRITPTDKKERFYRGSIGNFLFKLEQDSRRVKVTGLKISPLERVKPGEISDDIWTFEAEITSRQAVN